MMNKFILNFEPDIIVKCELLDNKLAIEWFDLLTKIHNDNNYYIEDVYTGFGIENEVEKIQLNLFNSIKYIEAQKPNTFDMNIILDELKLDNVFTQERLNHLHSIYEKITVDGNYNFESKLQKEVNDLNINIHRLEDGKNRNLRTIKNNRFRCRYLKKGEHKFVFEKKQILDEYNHLFSLDRMLGGIRLSYSQVGKDFVECYRRKDMITVPKPLNEYSASFIVDFGPHPDINIEKTMYNMDQWYKKNGYNIYDLKNRVGQAYVAKIIDIENLDSYIENISQKRKLSKVIIGENNV